MSREKRLNRDMLVSIIKKFCVINYKDFTVSDLINKGGQRHRVEIESDGMAFYVDFHFRDNGCTSIDTSTGKHGNEKKQIKEAILGDITCLIVDEKNK